MDSRPVFKIVTPSKITNSNWNAEEIEQLKDPLIFAAKMAKQTPRNLQEVPSAFDISPANAPINIYD